LAKQAQGEALAQEAALVRRLGAQSEELQGIWLAELRARHLDLFDAEPRSKNLPFLRRKLAFQVQERMEGGLRVVERAGFEPATFGLSAKRC